MRVKIRPPKSKQILESELLKILATIKYSDPFEQAEYIYSLIESEMSENE